MARNVEIKARVEDAEALRGRIEAVAGAPAARLVQRDSYFDSPNGRLKLREFDTGEAELIFYRRPDTPEPSLSDYLKVPVGSAAELCALLGTALGTGVVVEKVRTLWWLGATRVHLDAVAGLGDFLELEVTLAADASAADGEATAHALLEALGVPAEALEARGYAQLLASH